MTTSMERLSSPWQDVYKRQCPGDSEEIRAYLRGESLEMEAADTKAEGGRAGEKGWTLVLVDGYPVGWGKLAGGMLKNQ